MKNAGTEGAVMPIYNAPLHGMDFALRETGCPDRIRALLPPPHPAAAHGTR
jgi:hypothetical protein